jgi:uncharacterized membrane protein
MHWFYFAIAAPALWSISNHLDKYLLGKYFKEGGAGALLIFSCMIAVVFAPLILLFRPHVFGIPLSHLLLMVLNGLLYILALIPYMYAMQQDEASIVAPLFQLLAVFGYLVGVIFLNEHLTTQQLFASALIVTGAVLLSLDLVGKPRLKGRVFWLMCLASLVLAVNNGIFKFVAIQADFWTTIFWESVGIVFAGLLLLVCVPQYRRQFIAALRINRASVLGLNGCNEVINLVAKVSMNFATLLAPLAVVLVVNGFQPLFVFGYGVFLTIFFPTLATEDITKRGLAQKLISILIVCVGTYLLYSAH